MTITVMAPKNNTKAKKTPGQAKSKKKGSRLLSGAVAGARGTDPLKYARMLVDPCNAELVEPLYPGSVGTVRARWRSDIGMPTGPNSAAAIAFHPVLGTYIFQSVGPTAAGNFALAGETPGYAQMVTNAANYSGFRALAGCAEFQFLLSEQNRGGTIGVANVPGALVWNHLVAVEGGNGATTTVDQLRAVCAHTERIPPTSLEVNWVPAFGDQEFDFPPNYSASSRQTTLRESFARVNFILMVVNLANYSNTPGVASGRLVLTSAVEFNFSDGQGYLASTNMVQANPTSFTSVLGALQAKDPSWYVNAARKAAYLVGGAVRGYATGGTMGAILGVAGYTMPNTAQRYIRG